MVNRSAAADWRSSEHGRAQATEYSIGSLSRRLTALVAILVISGAHWACRDSGNGAAQTIVDDTSPTLAPSIETSSPESWPGLIDEAIGKYGDGDFDAARALLRFVADRGRSTRDTAIEARALTWLGLSAWRQGNLREARQSGEEALALKLSAGLHEQISRSYNALGLVAWHETRLGEAAELFDQALKSGRSAGDAGRVASAAGNLGLVLADLGDFAEARSAFEALRDAGRVLLEPWREANGLTNLGMLNTLVGDPAAAIPILTEARGIYREQGLATEEVAVRQLGDAYSALGDFGRAYAKYDTALALARSIENRQGEAANLEMLATLNLETGDPVRALDRFGEARRLYASIGIGMRLEVGRVARGEGLVHLELGDLDLASRRFREAVEIHRDTNTPFEELTDLVLLAEVAELAGSRRDADVWLAQATELADDLDAKSARLEVGLSAARIAEVREDPERTLEALESIRPMLPKGGYASEWEAEALAARALLSLGRYEDAVQAGRRAIAVVERIRGGLRSAALRTTYVSVRRDTYATLVSALLSVDRTDEAFEVSDAARGRALIEHVGAAASGLVRVDATAGRVAESEVLLRRIGTLSSSFQGLLGQLPADEGRFDAELMERAERLETARAHYENLFAASSPASPAALILGAATAALADVRDVLLPGEVVVEYLATNDRLFIFALSGQGVSVTESVIGEEELQTMVWVARELLGDPGLPDSDRAGVLEELHAVLIDPLEQGDLVREADHLLIVPHGALTYLPFSALLDPLSGRFLVERYVLTQLPSAAVLAAIRQRPGDMTANPVSGVEAFAPFEVELPASRDEVRAVGRVTGATEFVGSEATEGAVRRALARSRIIHLATHGVLNPRNPMFSRIELRPGGGLGSGFDGESASDGALEIHEVLGIAVRSELVFLSGCDTGLGAAASGRYVLGEDYATLARAFLYAGARNVIATLWPVEDLGAARFAGLFYEELGDGGPSVALAAAQRRMLASTEFAAPFYWAAYVISGSG